MIEYKKLLIPLVIISILFSSNALSFAPTFYHLGINYYSHSSDLDGLIWTNISFALCNNSLVSSNLSANCTSVYYYNSSSDTWQEWHNKTNDTLTDALSGYGYLVNISKLGDNGEGETNEIKGGREGVDPISDSSTKWRYMQLGWNLMGWTTADVNMNISEAVKLIYGNWSKNITRVWGYENNTDIMKPLWPEDPNSQFQAWLHAYWVCVSNDTNDTYCETTAPPLMPWQNNRSVLFNGSVNDYNNTSTVPTFKTTDSLTFKVNYMDPDNDSANPIQVIIDGVPYDMTISGSNYETGVTATLNSKDITTKASNPLSSGNHTYYFKASDGLNHTYYDGTNTTKYPKIPVIPQMKYHINYLPTPIINITTQYLKVNHSIQFIGNNSYDKEDGKNITYYWDFGDGTNSNQTNPSHIYTQAGNYTVTLTVTDNTGENNITTKTIEVKDNLKPIPVITHDKPKITLRQNNIDVFKATTQFTNNSYDPDGTIIKYYWQFGDGTTSTEATPTHTYTATGTFTVKLTITDDNGATNTTTTTIKIQYDPPKTTHKTLYDKRIPPHWKKNWRGTQPHPCNKQTKTKIKIKEFKEPVLKKKVVVEKQVAEKKATKSKVNIRKNKKPKTTKKTRATTRKTTTRTLRKTNFNY